MVPCPELNPQPWRFAQPANKIGAAQERKNSLVANFRDMEHPFPSNHCSLCLVPIAIPSYEADHLVASPESAMLSSARVMTARESQVVGDYDTPIRHILQAMVMSL